MVTTFINLKKTRTIALFSLFSLFELPFAPCTHMVGVINNSLAFLQQITDLMRFTILKILTVEEQRLKLKKEEEEIEEEEKRKS